MKLSKVIAIPALALTAGISLATCGQTRHLRQRQWSPTRLPHRLLRPRLAPPKRNAIYGKWHCFLT